MVNENLEHITLLEELYPNEIDQGKYEAIDSIDPDIKDIVKTISSYIDNGGSLASYKQQLLSAKTFYDDAINFYYNPNFDGRDIIKDDYNNQTEKYYGCNDSKGPDSAHGTHVAGIIAANRNNAIGIKGIAPNVTIMSIRTVPNGDERDKDVANAIYYAVDNGAKVINMSFGKAFSWNKKIVDNAVRYAQRKDALLIHAAGNNASELDGTNNFPNKNFGKRRFLGKKTPNNWIEVGATTYNFNENFVASFSNFDDYFVDIFAPGYQVYSTTPDNSYSKFNGTSMASPMVAGVAALLRSYFPKLSAKQVRKIILESATPIDLEVVRPDNRQKVEFKSLSVSGSILNAEAAVKMALKN